jgi:hypothetical protein
MKDTESFKEYVQGMLSDEELDNDTRIRLLKGWIERLVEDMVTLIQDSEELNKRQEWKSYLEIQLEKISIYNTSFDY